MEDLKTKHCVPCEGGVDPLTRPEFSGYLEQITGWQVIEDDKKIQRDFQFKDFPEALKFVNAVGAIAEDEGHHPDINLHSWNKVRITLYTHAIGGLSINDFVVASRIDRIKL
ncbi:MAG TPA: 4a-hydroxytetrahydrobiopterin dehydratase [candidate division Zixibacteria bacterium]|nr:4a-hydroxytetrahydrobiopterin dehydratase [candidate division Zixibacteria bacterium]